MKTKKFIEKLRDIGYVVNDKGFYIFIKNEFGDTFASILSDEILNIDTDYSSFRDLKEHDRRLLFDLIKEYASTPIEEREEEERYYIKLKNDVLAHTMAGDYLNFRKDNHIFEGESYMFSSKDSERFYNTEFTQKEIDNFPDEVKEFLPLCKQIEVTP